MNLSVIICTYNRAESLIKTLESLSAASVDPAIAWELILVDNNSSDNTRAIGEQFGEDLPLKYFFERKQGLSCARNRGVQEAQGELVVFIDDDVDVDPNWINALCDGARRNPDVNFFGGPVDAKWESPLPDWFACHASGLLSGIAVNYERKLDCPFLKEGEHTFVGANMMFRKAIFEAGFRFRENLGRKGTDLTGHEDTIFMRELLQAGHQGFYISGAKVYHRTSSERMTERYLRKWYIGAGRGVVQLSPDHFNHPLVFKAPRYLWRRLGWATLQFILSRWTRSSMVWVPAECEMALIWGQIVEYRQTAWKRE